MYRFLLVLLVGAACATTPTAIEVELQSDPELLPQATEVRVRVFSGRDLTSTPVRDTRAFFSRGLRLPEVATIVPRDGDAHREFTLIAELIADGTTIAEQRLVARFVAGQTVRVVLRFSSGCMPACGALETCVRGACVSACLAPVSGVLVRYDCEEPPPMPDAGTDTGGNDAGDLGMEFDSGPLDRGIADPDAGRTQAPTRGMWARSYAQ